MGLAHPLPQLPPFGVRPGKAGPLPTLLRPTPTPGPLLRVVGAQVRVAERRLSQGQGAESGGRGAGQVSRRMARTGGPGQQEVAHLRTDLSAGPRPQWVLANRSEWQIALPGLINYQPLISVFNTRRRPRLCHSPMLSPLSRPPAWCGQEVAPRAPPCHPLPVSGLFSATHGSSRPSARGGPWLRACSPVGLECLAWGSDSGCSQSWGIPMAYADRWPGAEALRRHRCGAEDRRAPGRHCGCGRRLAATTSDPCRLVPS